MIMKVIAVTVLLIASLSVAGCMINTTSPSSTTASPTTTPAPTVAPVADYSKDIGAAWESGGVMVERPFTKSINARGNDVYMGVLRSPESSKGFTLVEELAKSQVEAQQIFDQAKAKKIDEGYVTYPSGNTTGKGFTEQWAATTPNSGIQIYYQYDMTVHSWVVATKSMSLT